MKFFLLLVGIVSLFMVVNANKLDLYELLKARNELQSQNNEIDSYSVPVPTAVETHNLFIPTTIVACTNSQCQAICAALGYHHGNCVSPSTCHCY